ncbi:hypothetical protein AB0G35_15270 [Streptomyces sp. NPDC021749]|uniref:hypothetical protein n=1 Tax=Streptomyces sp. NPDC021749 TaxID=3154905 RepID=UPI0033C6535D
MALALAAAAFVIPLASAQPAAAVSECKGRIDFAKSRNYYAIQSSKRGNTREAASYNNATKREISHALPACRRAHDREKVRDLLHESTDYAERALDANMRKDKRRGLQYEQVIKARLEEALYRA